MIMICCMDLENEAIVVHFTAHPVAPSTATCNSKIIQNVC
jgi:hypothetical protein